MKNKAVFNINSLTTLEGTRYKLFCMQESLSRQDEEQDVDGW